MPPPNRIDFFVYGQPATQGSKRAFVTPSGVALADDNPRLKDWRAAVAQAARQAYRGPLLEGPVALDLTFRRPRPKGHFGTGRNAGTLKSSAPPRPTSKPDVTKLARAVEDALTGVIWRDDAQVVSLWASKLWGDCFSVHVTAWTRPE